MNNFRTGPTIICKNIHKYFGEGAARVHALRGVDLAIGKGELRLLMGPSGSGKTTLISIIAGILTQDEGVCLVNDVDLNRYTDVEKTRFRGRHFGFVFQAFNLVPMFTNEENMAIPLLINGTERKEAIQRAQQLMEELGMGDKIGFYPRQLSGGQQQRIAIGRSLIHEPQLIVCDEPTSFLDHETGMKIMELLKETAVKKHMTIIVVTHDPRVISFADKIDHLEDGKITPEST